MEASNTTNQKPAGRRYPFRNMLIFVIILFIIIWLVYRTNNVVSPQPVVNDTTQKTALSRDSIHPE